ncbi:DNA helicase HerA-like ATPase [Actinocorallia herbida]|uniref:DNA helicase HerA-like ATPase n=1 Tax=Actinocorallia herbida TaxID=58109 RepID=A0A3N1DC61_9ACTN|nr:ATP-binding protein [Actinocorallia herbida]ROO91107.1 DNA helicase HerA-like ATPase [Actinocorallia herbida]
MASAGPAPGPWMRIDAVPAAQRTASPEWDFLTMLPAALSAAQQGRPFVAGWMSRGGGTPLELVTNAVSGDGGLLFPNGARGIPYSGDWLGEADRLVWARCPGRQAPPLPSPPAEGASLFESMLVTLLGRPFGWLVAAEPRTEPELDEEVRAVRHELRMARRDEQGGFERLERRLAELDAYREGALWDVRVLAGAASHADLERVAPVLVGSVELGHHPYRLRTGRGAHTLREALAGAEDGFPFSATAGVLAPLAGLPRREVPGVRVLDSGSFDVTSETPPGGLVLGDILDGRDRPVGAFTVPLETLNRHAFVTGATGSGKSQTVRHLLEQLTAAGVPWLAIEPAKSEYAAMAGRIGAPVTVVNPSDPAAVPLSVNPLAPEPGYPVQAHIDMVRALFQAAFAADEPFPQIIAQALQRVYEENGWDVVTGAGRPGAHVRPAVPTLEQLQRAALEVIDDVGYGKELMADVKGFVDVRLRSLRIGSAGRFFEGGHDADISRMLRENVVLAIEDVANDEDKAFLMGTLIIRVVEHLRMQAREERPPGLRHVIVIEEAHRLLRHREHSSAHAVELFAGLLAEIRAYGEGIVVAEQIPVKLIPDVVKNTALKIVHRLPAFDDRHVVGSAMNLDPDQSREVVSLRPGVAAVFADGMDRPLRVRVPHGEGRERRMPGPPPPIAGRRSAACGRECRAGRACSLRELREAELLAGRAEQAWLRLWADVLVLAHLVNRPLPEVPADLRRAWQRLAVRTRECMLATVVDRTIDRRARALRDTFDPADLTWTVTAAAGALLGGAVATEPPGPGFVIPQLRWLHEIDKLLPLDVPDPDAHAPAPPLDYVLPGLRSRDPAVKMGHRLHALRRHPLSMDLPANRPVALTALTGTLPDPFESDLETVSVGLPSDAHLDHLTTSLNAPWLPAILSWPDRFIDPPEEARSDPHDL